MTYEPRLHGAWEVEGLGLEPPERLLALVRRLTAPGLDERRERPGRRRRGRVAAEGIQQRGRQQDGREAEVDVGHDGALLVLDVGRDQSHQLGRLRVDQRAAAAAAVHGRAALDQRGAARPGPAGDLLALSGWLSTATSGDVTSPKGDISYIIYIYIYI